MSEDRVLGASAAQTGERLPVSQKLRRRPEYLNCYREGRRRHGRHAVLHFAPNELGHPRLGITASRKVGGAVVRQRLRRRTREAYRRWRGRSQLPAMDIVVHLKPAAAHSSFSELRQELIRLMSSLDGDRPR